jgi:hypothetical protein
MGYVGIGMRWVGFFNCLDFEVLAIYFHFYMRFGLNEEHAPGLIMFFFFKKKEYANFSKINISPFKKCFLLVLPLSRLKF